jgi:hypothetical protein
MPLSLSPGHLSPGHLSPILPHSPSSVYSPSSIFSRSCSPVELNALDLYQYMPVPSQDTVIHHPPYNLPAMDIVINLSFCCLICLKCERALDTSNLIEHVRRDLPFFNISEDLPSILQMKYNLIPYSSFTYTPGPKPSVFGIPLQREPIFFAIVERVIPTLICYEPIRPVMTNANAPLVPKK